jgi:hypothetical protein
MSRGGTSADIAELALGHSLSTLRRTYDRHEFEAEKRLCFERLAETVETIVRPPPADTVVVPITTGRRK